MPDYNASEREKDIIITDEAVERVEVGRKALEKMILHDASELAPQYGIEIVDVRIKRINSEVAIFVDCSCMRISISGVSSPGPVSPIWINSNLRRYLTIWRANSRTSLPASRARWI